MGQEEQGITLSVPKLVLLFALMLLWGYLGGQTGFFYQNSDWGYRNAIYRDLITNSWPVYYPQRIRRWCIISGTGWSRRR